MDVSAKALKEIEELFDELDSLLKTEGSGDALAARGVNVSLALTAVNGLRAYLRGDKPEAVEDFETVAEEIRARMQDRAASREKPSTEKPS